MGARQSRRSVDITTTPKKGGEVDNVGEGEGKVEKIGDLEAKVTTNGAIHTELEYADKEENEKDQEAIKENGVSDSETPKTPEGDVSAGDQLNESSDAAEKSADSTEKSDETSECNKKNKEKTKKKKWSFRSISFSKKDKSKPNKDSEKNGEVKEVAEEGAEENATSAAEVTKTEGEQPSESITNGEASTEEINKSSETSAPLKTEESPKQAEEAKEEAKVEPVTEKPFENPAPTSEKEESKTVDEPKVEESKAPTEESKTVEPIAENSKEVRNEEIPPPLPSSNPPSPVTVFAESTMAEQTLAEDLQKAQPPVSAPVVETISESVAEPVVQSLSEAAVSSPITENIPDLPAPVIESVSAQSPIQQESNISIAQASPVQNDVQDKLVDLCPLPAKTEHSEDILPSVPEQVVNETASNNACLLPPSSPELSAPPAVEVVPDIANTLIQESFSDPTCPISSESMPDSELLPSPSKDNDFLPPAPEDISHPLETVPSTTEQVINADSLPDISTESLPSLPEPTSESLPEPMSLPPVDCVPEPIASEPVPVDALPESNSLPEPSPNTLPEPEKVPEPIADITLPTGEMVLTNGDANGLPSPIANDVTLPTIDRPIKQVVAPNEISAIENIVEDKQEGGDKIEAVEPTPSKAGE